MNRLRRGALIGVFFVVLAHQAGHSENRLSPHIFSDVKYIEEAGDLVGYELEIQADSPQITGLLKIYQGGCAQPVSLSGTNTGGKLKLHGKSEAYGNIELTGRIVGNLLKAILRMEKPAHQEGLQLKAISKSHC